MTLTILKNPEKQEEPKEPEISDFRRNMKYGSHKDSYLVVDGFESEHDADVIEEFIHDLILTNN